MLFRSGGQASWHRPNCFMEIFHYVYSSGRIPVDMAVKAIRAGIPVLAAKAVPTCEAVRLAGKYGLTLVCSARRDMMRVCVS